MNNSIALLFNNIFTTFFYSVLTIKLLLSIVSNTSNLLWEASQETTSSYYFLISLVSYST